MLKHTKIVATVSDQRCEVEFIDALYKAGMNVVRLNTAHMAEEGLTRETRKGRLRMIVFVSHTGILSMT